MFGGYYFVNDKAPCGRKEGEASAMRARTLQFEGPRRLATVEIDLPEPGAGEMLVRTLYSGISSGTELLVYRGDVDPDMSLDETIAPLRGSFSYPFRYGYSCVGVVERSQGLVPPGAVVFVFHPHQDRFVCAMDGATEVSGVDPRLATLFPLVETALQITLDGGEVLDEDVVVMGLGTVGALTAMLLQRGGARVIGVDPSGWRRDLARELDIHAVRPGEAEEGVAVATSGEGVPLVVEVSGNPSALESALPLLAQEGTALVASWYGTKPVTLRLGAEFHRRRLAIRSTQVSTIPSWLSGRWTTERRRNHAVRLLSELPLKKFATHEFPFARAREAFAALDRGDEDIMHAALTYEPADRCSR
jgi:2-desacetyl-2-hydroxyethyl bacteriochlorophyllide A dehydrogenase